MRWKEEISRISGFIISFHTLVEICYHTHFDRPRRGFDFSFAFQFSSVFIYSFPLAEKHACDVYWRPDVSDISSAASWIRRIEMSSVLYAMIESGQTFAANCDSNYVLYNMHISYSRDRGCMFWILCRAKDRYRNFGVKSFFHKKKKRHRNTSSWYFREVISRLSH